MNPDIPLQQQPRPRRRRTLTPTVTVGVLYAVLLATVGLLSLAASLPPNIVWGRTQLSELRAQLNRTIGQDFAFFTRSPETDEIDAYRLNPDATTGASLLVTPQAKASNLFGLSRTQRAQGPELAILLRAVPTPGWVDCSALERATCLAELRRRPKTLLHNTSPIPTVCGDVALSIESTTKWAYRRLADTGYRIDRIAPTVIDCPHQR